MTLRACAHGSGPVVEVHGFPALFMVSPVGDALNNFFVLSFSPCDFEPHGLQLLHRVFADRNLVARSLRPKICVVALAQPIAHPLSSTLPGKSFARHHSGGDYAISLRASFV